MQTQMPNDTQNTQTWGQGHGKTKHYVPTNIHCDIYSHTEKHTNAQTHTKNSQPSPHPLTHTGTQTQSNIERLHQIIYEWGCVRD